MRKKFLTFGSPCIGSSEIDAVADVLRSGWLGAGPKVAMFETQFSKYKSIPYSVALNSCTAALHLSLLALKIKAGDEVLVPTLSFAATANAVVHAGATPVFVDCERRTMNIDPGEIERKITRRTKAVIPVHFAGRPCAMDAIRAIARRRNLFIIEDCAHALEGQYLGKPLGTWGDLGCFSFYVTKNVVTGDGGMVITRNRLRADTIRVLASHGMSRGAWKRFSDKDYKPYRIIAAGYKYAMIDMQAVLGIHQLRNVERYWVRRKSVWQTYDRAFAKLPVRTPAPVESHARHAFHLYTLLLDLDAIRLTRDRFVTEMTKHNIGVGVHYEALHLQPFYRKKFGYTKGDFPNAEWVSERTVSLPLSANLGQADVEDVMETVTSLLAKVKK